jgi:FAD synthase
MLTQKHCLDFEKVLATILAKDFLGLKLKKHLRQKVAAGFRFVLSRAWH